MPLEYADLSKTKTYKDGAAWLELRLELTGSDEDLIADLNSTYRLPAGLFDGSVTAEDQPPIEVTTNTREINRALFDILAVAWSLGDGKPSAADYGRLVGASKDWVDECITDAIRIGKGRAEGKPRSSKRRRTSRASSPAEAASTSTPSQGRTTCSAATWAA
jgi:hypothetical protein